MIFQGFIRISWICRPEDLEAGSLMPEGFARLAPPVAGLRPRTNPLKETYRSQDVDLRMSLEAWKLYTDILEPGSLETTGSEVSWLAGWLAGWLTGWLAGWTEGLKCKLTRSTL